MKIKTSHIAVFSIASLVIGAFTLKAMSPLHATILSANAIGGSNIQAPPRINSFVFAAPSASLNHYEIPVLGFVGIASSNSDKSKAHVGDTITVYFTSSEDVSHANVTIDGASASVHGGPRNFEASQKMVDASIEGNIQFTIDFSDSYGNKGVTVTSTTDASGVIFDKGGPVITEIVPVFTPTTEIAPTYIFVSTKPGVILYEGDCSSTQKAANQGNNSIVFQAMPEGLHANCTIQVQDSMGHKSNILKISPFTIDLSSPVLPTVSIASNDLNPEKAQVGDLITVKFKANKNLQIPSVTIDGSSATVQHVSDFWQASQVMVNANNEGTIPFTIDYSDLAGNMGAEVNSTTDKSNVIFSKGDFPKAGMVLGVSTTRVQQNFKELAPLLFTTLLHAILLR